MPLEPTAAGFRLRLPHLSAIDQRTDPRDELLALQLVCERAREASVDINPILREPATMSSDADNYAWVPPAPCCARG